MLNKFYLSEQNKRVHAVLVWSGLLYPMSYSLAWISAESLTLIE